AGLDAETWREMRARHFPETPDGLLEKLRRDLKEFDDAVAGFFKHEEVVIWLDHKVMDQLLLIRLLDWFSRRDLGNVKLSLICIGEYPGAQYFVGLGGCKPEWLAGLMDIRHEVSEGELRAGRAAWEAFTSPDPRLIERFLASDTSALPFLS